MITEEQFEYLQQFDDAFNTSTKSNYIKQSIKSADVIKLRAMYSELIGYQYKMNNACGKCILNLMKRLSKYYFEYKNE